MGGCCVSTNEKPADNNGLRPEGGIKKQNTTTEVPVLESRDSKQKVEAKTEEAPAADQFVAEKSTPEVKKSSAVSKSPVKTIGGESAPGVDEVIKLDKQ